VKQSPSGGSQTAQGSAVSIDVSSGKPPAPKNAAVPDVVGDDEGQATSALQKAGFNVNVNHVDSTKPRGMVIGQNPGGGTKADPTTTTVSIDVSSGKPPPKQVSVPNEVGKDVSAATSDLKGAGFKVSVTYQKVPHPAKDGIVLGQSPSGGSADEHSTVTLTVGKY
jgi:serine/threonine-protein kinase